MEWYADTGRVAARSVYGRKKKAAGRTELILKAVFFIYIALVIRCLIFKYSPEHFRRIMETWQTGVILEGLDTANFTLFKTIKMYLHYYEQMNSFENLFGNVLAFVPFGMLLPFLVKKERGDFFNTLGFTFLFSLGIEVFQLFSGFGAFDVDDILLNCVGGMAGYILFFFLIRPYIKYCLKKRIKNPKNRGKEKQNSI